MREDRTLSVRDLTREDLAVLLEPRVGPPQVKKLRDSHHRIARLVAHGVKRTKIAEVTGLSYTRLSVLSVDPAFKELVARYTAQLHEKLDLAEDAFVEIAMQNMLRAELMISDRLDDADDSGELLPIRELVSISRDAADRLGYGKHQTQTNVNVDFASRLERTIKRSARVIDAKAIPLSPSVGPSVSSPQEPERVVDSDPRRPARDLRRV